MYSHVDMHAQEYFRLNVSLPLSLEMYEYVSLIQYQPRNHAFKLDRFIYIVLYDMHTMF